MQIRFQGDEYTMTLFHALSFHLQMLWFPFRRLCRAVKRCIKVLKGWIPALVVFMPLVIAVVVLLWTMGLADVQTIIAELAFFFLGSFALLAIREMIESERIRHSRLRNQWAFCTDLHERFGHSLEIIGKEFGVNLDKWTALNSWQNLEEQLGPLQDLDNLTEEQTNLIKSELDLLRKGLVEIKEESRAVGFVDCSFAHGDFWLVTESESEVCNMLRRLRECDFQVKNEFRSICFQCLYILGELRGPWRYEIDVAHTKLIYKTIEMHAVRA